ncbi:hypothetical protein MMC27_002151 [Xylographa pallens]|nr:hypothetical protein [Xylographa pallens]
MPRALVDELGSGYEPLWKELWKMDVDVNSEILLAAVLDQVTAVAVEDEDTDDVDTDGEVKISMMKIPMTKLFFRLEYQAYRQDLTTSAPDKVDPAAKRLRLYRHVPLASPNYNALRGPTSVQDTADRCPSASMPARAQLPILVSDLKILSTVLRDSHSEPRGGSFRGPMHLRPVADRMHDCDARIRALAAGGARWRSHWLVACTWILGTGPRVLF